MEEFKDIVENFREEFQKAKDVGLIDKEMIINYEIANRECVHSIIQYLLMKSGERAGFIPIPEMKIKHEPTNYGFKKRKQSQYKTDVAFYKLHEKKKELIGISEIFTLDMLAHLLTTEELEEKVRERLKKWKKYPTSSTKILHLIQHPKDQPVNNILFVVILPEHFEERKGPSWPDWECLRNGKNNIFEVFSPYVKKLESEIREIGCKSYHILIKENEIITD